MSNVDVSPQDLSPTAVRTELLSPLRDATAGFQRLADLEVSGRTMMTFMRGHMAEMRTLQEVREYFTAYYGRMGREFLQFDDYGFVVHHCVRYQFWHMKEELDLLGAGALGRALIGIGVPLPKLGTPTSPGRRPPIAHGWYEDVYRSLQAGVLPEPRGARNPVMPPEDCVMRRDEQLDLIWPQFLIWCGEAWGRQIVAGWQVLRSLIALRRRVDEQLTAARVDQLVGADEEAHKEASQALSRTYQEWHDFHAGTVDVHDPMYDANREGLFAWAGDLAPDITVWGIKDATKDEMYLELAAGVQALRGQAVSVDLPEPAYWRRTQFVPDCLRLGAPGMPPF